MYARTAELKERIAIWECWLGDFGGRTFIEPPAGRFVLTMFVNGAWSPVMRGLERREGLDLVRTMRARGFAATLERDPRRGP